MTLYTYSVTNVTFVYLILYEVVTIAVLSNIVNITNAIVRTCKKSLSPSTNTGYVSVAIHC